MIGEKMLKIMDEIEPIARTVLDEENNYKSAKIEKIIEMVRPLLIKHKVLLLPVEVKDKNPQGNKVHFTIVYHFIDAESEEKEYIPIEIPASGHDEKNGRAAFYALTGAYKYAMQQGLAIPIVDEIIDKTDDTEVENDEINENIPNINDDNNDIGAMSSEDIESLFSSTTV